MQNSQIIALIIAIGLLLWMLHLPLPFLIKRAQRRSMFDDLRRSGCVCLTFDDGPDPAGTPAVLDLLHRAGARATFFLLGRNAAAHPDLVKRIAAAGHEIAEHSYAHRNAWEMGPLATLRDLAEGRRAIERALPEWRPRPGLLRPPHGKVNLFTFLYTTLAHRKLVFWNVNPSDFACESGEEVARRVTPHLAPGAVVLLHDGRRTESEYGATTPHATVEGLALLLEEIARRGLRATTVSEALKRATTDRGKTA